MSGVSELQITGIRNIADAALHCHPKLNILYGVNGSGKTSVLESVYLLSRGKSFRTPNTDSLVNEHSREGVVFTNLMSGARIGLSKGRSDRTRLKLDEDLQQNWDQVAQKLPVLVIDASTFQLLEGGPKSRRQFLDWGVFHVEHSFIQHWRRFRKALANRNQLLKSGVNSDSLLDAWSSELILAGEKIDQCRAAYFESLIPVFESVYASLVRKDTPELSITYSRGWSEELSLADALRNSLSNDRRYKSTQIGPQRADLVIKAGNRLAAEVLSRGQQKLVVCALKIAQGDLYYHTRDSACIYLVDDLPAELDAENRKSVLDCLERTGAQLFVTCVQLDALPLGEKEGNQFTAFHVERGKIAAC